MNVRDIELYIARPQDRSIPKAHIHHTKTKHASVQGKNGELTVRKVSKREMNKLWNKCWVEFISYNGEYPNLCSGKLVMRVRGKLITFPDYTLSSGGGIWFDDNWSEHVEQGEWRICYWPTNFPDELKELATELVNANIEQGCCGGCI